MEVLDPRCAGLDVHKETVVACVRLAVGGREVAREVRTFATTTAGLLELAEWLAEGGFALVLANAAQVKNVPGRNGSKCSPACRALTLLIPRDYP